jgi:hypothetical protein
MLANRLDNRATLRARGSKNGYDLRHDQQMCVFWTRCTNINYVVFSNQLEDTLDLRHNRPHFNPRLVPLSYM